MGIFISGAHVLGQLDWLKLPVGGALKPGPLLILDQFTDPDGTALTAHTIAPTNTPGAAWTAVNGTFKIFFTERAVPNTNGADDQVQCDCGQSDITITADVVAQASSLPDLMLRWTDSTHLWLCDIDVANAYIYENAGAGYVLRASGSYASILSVSHTVKVVALGTTITIYMDGVQIATYGSASSNQTATKVGLRVGQAGGGTPCSWDNFQVTSP